jgi:hypothetical protein
MSMNQGLFVAGVVFSALFLWGATSTEKETWQLVGMGAIAAAPLLAIIFNMLAEEAESA